MATNIAYEGQFQSLSLTTLFPQHQQAITVLKSVHFYLSLLH